MTEFPAAGECLQAVNCDRMLIQHAMACMPLFVVPRRTWRRGTSVNRVRESKRDKQTETRLRIWWENNVLMACYFFAALCAA